MKRTLIKLLAALSLSVALVTPAFAATTGIGNVVLQPGDSSVTLGVNPTFLYGMWLDPFGAQYKYVTDSTSGAPAALGKILYFTGQTWIEALTANLAVPRGLYGVVVQPATAVNGVAWIQVQGLVYASVKTASTACAATGAVPLASTITGDLAPTAAATTPGITWGICSGVLAINSGPALTQIVIGGY